MKISHLLRRTLLLLAGAAVSAGAANAPGLNIYAVNINGLTYVTGAPYLQWPLSSVQANPTSWIIPNQFLVIQTNQQYQHGSWAIQVFTDNTRHANAAGTFNLPDYINCNGTLIASSANGATTPIYGGVESYGSGTTQVFPKAGLVTADGKSRLSLIWSVYDCLPDSSGQSCKPGADGKVAPITENPPNTGCNFFTCNWFYFEDKGDQQIPQGQALQYSWVDGADYVSPLNQFGWKWGEAPSQRAQPTVVPVVPYGPSDENVIKYLYIAANFRNATRQVYSTTVFVELVTL